MRPGCATGSACRPVATGAVDGMRLPPPPFDPRWALFLDVDGTLLEFAGDPGAVRADAGLAQLLADLRSACGGALALISGRSVASLDGIFSPLRLPVAGQHGLERRDAAGGMHHHDFPRERLRRAAGELGAFAAAHAGLILEDKGASVALHFRRAPELEPRCRDAIRAAQAAVGDAFEVQGGKMVFELKPSGRDKGAAIAEFMVEPPFAGRLPAFLGDDATDEFGFDVVNQLGGHSVKVGEGEGAARWRIADAREVRSWLQHGLGAGGT
jgi:trehalose 6-phosphate phosphatase